MHIITIMDYSDGDSVIMCKSWILFALRFNPKATITIFHIKKIDRLRRFARRFPSVRFRTLTIPRSVGGITGGHIHHPVQDLQLGLWHTTQSLGIHTYIYADADALILDSLDTWWSHIGDKPYIGIAERRLPDGKLLLNAGVYSYSDDRGFVTLPKLLRQYETDGDEIRFEAGQQGLINSYFQRIGYDYTHPLIGHEYNSLAKYSRILRADNREINIESGTYPLIRRIVLALKGRGSDWASGWLWWHLKKRVKILHAFGGAGFRFWELPECADLWRYCIRATSYKHRGERISSRQ